MSDLHQHENEFSRRLNDLPCDDAPCPEHQARLHEQVLARFDQVATSTTVVPSWKHFIDSWRTVMRRPVPRLIAATITCLTISAFWLFVPGHQSKAFGFNNFAAALVEAKTAKFQMEVKIEGFPAQMSQAYYLAPEKFRLEMTTLGAGTVSISDDRTGNFVMLLPATKTAMVMNSKGKPKDEPPKDPFFRLRELLSKESDQKQTSFKAIEDQEINGKRAVGFRSETPIGRCTLWGDPTTGHPVRVEIVWSGTPKNETTLSDFEINVDLNESLFDLTPPAGYKLQSIEFDASRPKEADLVNAFKTCVEIGNAFPDSIGLLGQTFFYTKHTKDFFKNNPSNEEIQALTSRLIPIGRGFRFALELPATADAHYAGKGVKPGAADSPIFWYKPDGSTKYRVLHSDLSITDTDTPPQAPEAEKLNKAAE